MPNPNTDNPDHLDDVDLKIDPRQSGALGGLRSWANTRDRQRRMATPQSKSPAHWEWHAQRLGLDPAHMTPDDIARAESARRAYMLELSIKAGRARKRNRAKALRARADELDKLAAEVEDGGGD